MPVGGRQARRRERDGQTRAGSQPHPLARPGAGCVVRFVAAAVGP